MWLFLSFGVARVASGLNHRCYMGNLQS